MNGSALAKLPLQLRQAAQRDAPLISQLIYQSCRPQILASLSSEAHQAFLQQIHPRELELRMRQDCCYWLLEQQGAALATLGLQQGFHLRHLFVAPEWQHQGLADRLWQEVQRLRQPRYFSVYAWPKAVPLYYRWGFRPMGKTIVRAHMPVIPMLRFSEQNPI